MTWTEALEIVVARTRHERYRELCADDRPDHEVWRAKVVELAGTPAEYPPLLAQARNAAGALGRVASALAHGRQVVASAEEQGRRLSICRDCPEFVAADVRCLRCGCALPLKARLQIEHCPLDPPRW
jgi:hypothetical protein